MQELQEKLKEIKEGLTQNMQSQLETEKSKMKMTTEE
jgi:hypothetical protein